MAGTALYIPVQIPNLSVTDAESGKFIDLGNNGTSGTLAVRTASQIVYNGTQGTLTSGQGTTMQSDINGNLKVTLATKLAGENLTDDVMNVRMNGRPIVNVVTFGTTFGGTAAGYGTLAAAPGTGIAIWVNDLSINNPNGTAVCLVGYGTALNGTTVLAKGNYGTQTAVGIEKHFPLPVNGSITNTALVCYVGAAGTVDFNVTYFVSA